jgi:multicomponent K+:H+ antiporter subunit D
MTHWIVMPVVVPALTAALLVLLAHRGIRVQRIVSLAATMALLAVAAGLWPLAAGGPYAYLIGSWPAPFGIVLVLDRLAALMLLLSGAVALAALLYAVAGWDTRGRHFHALFQFQLLGINGAFLTGDVFNLFVFFEVMLIASYGLLLHGGGAWRLKAGFHYVAINLVASTLFLFAVGLIYGVTGTLNMADLALKVARLPEGDHALLAVAALVLFAVFATKAALVPLHWWLPGTYSAGPAPAIALFAVLTKVGAYSIIRMHALVFGGDAAGVSGLLQQLLLPAAMLTLLLGAVGVLASRTMLALASFSIIASMGTLLIAASGLDPGRLSASLYYLLHSTLIGAALFLLVDLLADGRGRIADRLVPGAGVARPALLGTMFLLAGMAMVGLPPLSGFVGKVVILDSLRAAPGAGLAWAVILGTSLLLLVGYARAGSTLFWKAATAVEGRRPPAGGPLFVVGALLASTAALSVLGGPVMDAMDATAREMLEPDRYIRAVLPETGARSAAAMAGP